MTLEKGKLSVCLKFFITIIGEKRMKKWEMAQGLGVCVP